jgi:signal transduction histidine kinase
VARVVVEHGVAALGAVAGAVAGLDGESGDLLLLGAVGYPAEEAERYARIPIGTRFPLADAARGGEAIILRTAAERELRYPHLEALRRANGEGAMAAVPLAVEGRRVGAIGINFPEGTALDAEDERFVLALAQQCAQSLDRARLYEAEQTARRTAERLQALTAALSGAATPAAVGAVVLDEGVRALDARAGVVALLTPGGDALEIVASAGYPPEACMGVGRRWPAAAAMPIADATRSRHGVFVGSTAEWRRRYPDGYVPPRAGDAAWAALPLGDPAVGAAGALLWTFDGARVFGRDERALMETVARLCAQALERALLYEAERAAREEAQRQRAAAEEANRTKSDFLATMSHELRTPLNAIGGYTDLLEMGVRGPVTEAQRADLARIRRSQRHLLSLVNDVLDFVRLDAGQVHYEIADVPVAELMAHVTALVAPQMAEKSLAFATECQDGAAVRADRDKVAQVLLNLLANAIKFTPEGGRVTLACARGERAGDAVMRFRVADTGVGIAPEHTATIFEPFVQVQRGLTRSAQGVGLGLAISRDIAEAMRGDLAVESTPGAGSVFTLTLPAA